jgi:cellulose synthase/poly-beta-1,6-N-acetylglucosamine synthase-like glycosyltransferase
MIGLFFWAGAGLVAYTYVGYPLLVTLLSAAFGRDRQYPPHSPKVTLIVAAYNEEAVIDRKLRDTAGLAYPPELLQVIVAADGSDDATAGIARTHGVEVVHRPERRGKMAAINRALEWANGDVIVFTDANNTLRHDAIEQIVAPFADPTVGAVTGRKVTGGDSDLGFSEGAYWRYEAHLRQMESRLGCTVGVNGEIFAIRRDLMEATPDTVVNDDQWMAHRVIKRGYRVAFQPEAVSEEIVSSDAGAERERRSRMVAGQWQVFGRLHREIPWSRPLVAWMLVSHKIFRSLVPFGMVAALGASIAATAVAPSEGLLALAPPWGAITLIAQAGFYAVAAAPALLRPLGKAAYVPRFLVNSNYAAVRGLWRHLRGGQTAAWKRAERSQP